MLRANEINKEQLRFVKSIAEGEIEMPSTSFELSELVKKALLLRDHEAEEAEAVRRSKIQFIKVIQQKSDEDGWIYLSVIRNVLARRSYFRDLERSQSLRKIDAMRSLARSLIEIGVVKRVDAQAMLTDKASEYLSELVWVNNKESP